MFKVSTLRRPRKIMMMMIIQIYFSKNYQKFHQDEVQPAHWSYSQILIFTCCIWSTTGVYSICLVSDNLSYDKFAVHTFLAKLLQLVKDQIPATKKIKTFSNDYAAQLKNCFLFSNLSWYKESYDLDSLKWNFFATSHGKGPVDGLGCHVKRAVQKRVLSRKCSVGKLQVL